MERSPSGLVVDEQVARYEALIHVHASRVVGLVDDDFEDVVQAYRIKVWQALTSFNPAKWARHPAEEAERRYVFMCLKNAEKDALKKRRRPESFLEDMTPIEGDTTTVMGSVDHDDVYGEVDEGRAQLPNTLTLLELHVVVLLYRDYSQAEARRQLGIEKREMERTMRSVRTKLADWSPTADDVVVDLGDIGPAKLPTQIAA